MSNKILGTWELEEMTWDAEDRGLELFVQRSEIDDWVIEYIEIEGETFENDLLQEELDMTDHDRREANRYYYD